MLKTISRDDLKQAKKFLASPYFNTDPLISTLFDLVCKCHPKMLGPSLENENLFKAIFPTTKEYDDHKLRKLRSKLIKLLEQFLTLEILKKQPNTQGRLLVEAYRQAGLFPYFKTALEELQIGVEKQKARGVEYHDDMAWLLHQSYFHPETPKNKASSQLLADLVHHLEYGFTLRSLCYGAELGVLNNLLTNASPAHYYSKVLAVAKAAFGEGSAPVYFLHELLITWADPAIEFDFQGIQKKMLELEQDMGPFVSAICWKLYNNAGVVRSNRGEASAKKALLESYKLLFDRGLVGPDKNLEVQSYLNCVTAGSHAGEFEWVEKFMAKNLPCFNMDIQKRLSGLSDAILFYNKALWLKKPGYLNKASFLLTHISHSDEIFGLMLRPLTLRIQYDSLPYGHPEVKPLLDEAKNASAFFDNHPVLAAQKRQDYKKFIVYLTKMARLKSVGAKAQNLLADLEKQLASESEIILKHWLEKKLEELKNPSSLDWLQS